MPTDGRAAHAARAARRRFGGEPPHLLDLRQRCAPVAVTLLGEGELRLLAATRAAAARGAGGGRRVARRARRRERGAARAARRLLPFRD